MTPKQYYDSRSKDQVKAMCKAAGTSYANFQQIATQNGHCGKVMAEKLAKASGNLMTELEVLYPERYQG